MCILRHGPVSSGPSCVWDRRGSHAAAPGVVALRSVAAHFDVVFLGKGLAVFRDQRRKNLLIRLEILGDQGELTGLRIPLRHGTKAIATMVLTGNLNSGPKFGRPSAAIFSSVISRFSMPSRICAALMAAVPWISCAVLIASAASIAAYIPRLYRTEPIWSPAPAALPVSTTCFWMSAYSG